MIVSTASEQALQDALQRLAEGRPGTTGALTVVGLAAEAGVSRSTANRSPAALEGLRALRRRREITAEIVPPAFAERDARKEMAELRRRHADKVAVLERSIEVLAQHVQALTLDNERLRRAVATGEPNVIQHRPPTHEL